MVERPCECGRSCCILVGWKCVIVNECTVEGLNEKHNTNKAICNSKMLLVVVVVVIILLSSLKCRVVEDL